MEREYYYWNGNRWISAGFVHHLMDFNKIKEIWTSPVCVMKTPKQTAKVN